MSFIEQIEAELADGRSLDAANRLRVSQENSQLDLKQLHDSLPLFYDIETIGTGATAHSVTEARTQLTTAASSDAVIMQTKQRANYQSNKSQLVAMTFDTFAPETNIVKRVGYFTNRDSNTPFDTNKDGMWIESEGGTVKVVISHNGTANTIEQVDWDDPLDGTGDSTITKDWDENTIFVIDFLWLGLGRVRFGIKYNGLVYYFHEVSHSETSGVYIASPNQPLRAEVRQTGVGTGTLNFVCSSVASEGSINKLGKILSENMDTTHVNAGSSGTIYCLIGIRLGSSTLDTLIDLLSFSVLATTNDNQLIEVYLNPTITGITPVWNAYTNSSVETFIAAASGSNKVTAGTGTRLFSAYMSQMTARDFEFINALRLGSNIDHTADEIILTATPLSSNSDVLGAINWRELT